MNVFESFEDRPKFTVPGWKRAVGENGAEPGNRLERDGRQTFAANRSEKDRLERGASDLAQAA
jgi:hypothetical protein